MTIETKYNIGDEVWVKVQGEPTALKVVGFYISLKMMIHT